MRGMMLLLLTSQGCGQTGRRRWREDASRNTTGSIKQSL